ncbi:phage protein D [Pedobacter sp. UYP30]|uniref:hypothetical protein n=1 Tax=Pedobacter sp. UYP30 TaxID=1756400 RepID=UPI0033910463
MHFNIKPTFTSPIDYMIQYRESDSDFINRLSAQYHEWFYYNGKELQFGKPDELPETTLVYGRDLSNVQDGIQIAPLKYKKFAYNPKADEMLTANGEGKKRQSR